MSHFLDNLSFYNNLGYDNLIFKDLALKKCFAEN